LRYTANFAAGKNKIINGDLGVWQRGTSFTTQSVYGPDRWFLTGVTSNMTFAQVTSSLPSAFQYGIKLQRNSGATNTDIFSIAQPFETSTSIPLQGQTVTLSFWAKAGANFSATSGVALIRLYSGTGTNQSAATQFGGWTGYSEWQNTGTFSPTATWTRFSVTGTVPSNATQIGLRIGWAAAGTAGADDSLQITGVQLEAANTATAFQTATGTIQGELAACQRYYYRSKAPSAYSQIGVGPTPPATTSIIYMNVTTPVPMRTSVQSVDWGGNMGISDGVNVNTGISSIVPSGGNGGNFGSFATVAITMTSGVLTLYRPYYITDNGAGTTFLGISMEL
jgi:hypothetical protein